MDTRNTFAERLVLLRSEKGLTQGALAESIGISRQSVTLYENHTRVPDIEILAKFAEFFGVTSDYLLGRSDNRTYENAAIGDKLGLTDKSIATLICHKEWSEGHNLDASFTGLREYFIQSSKDYIRIANILLSQYHCMGALARYIFSHKDNYVEAFESTYLKYDFGDDEKNDFFKNYFFKQEQDEVNQAINMYRVQKELMAVREEIIKQQEETNAKENKRQE